MSKKKESFFWTSYSDLMTSLFFIMLTLFVLVVVLLNQRNAFTKAKLERIEAIQKSTQELDRQNGYFEYNRQYEKYSLKINVFFPELQTDFAYLSPSCKDSLRRAGEEIVSFLTKHSQNKYLLIVEGQASRNSEKWMLRNYDLSFKRAMNLMDYWLNTCRLQFGNNCEVQIAGSGDGRLNRNSMREPVSRERFNQRFLIYIIPKNILHEE